MLSALSRYKSTRKSPLCPGWDRFQPKLVHSRGFVSMGAVDPSAPMLFEVVGMYLAITFFDTFSFYRLTPLKWDKL